MPKWSEDTFALKPMPCQDQKHWRANAGTLKNPTNSRSTLALVGEGETSSGAGRASDPCPPFQQTRWSSEGEKLKSDTRPPSVTSKNVSFIPNHRTKCRACLTVMNDCNTFHCYQRIMHIQHNCVPLLANPLYRPASITNCSMRPHLARSVAASARSSSRRFSARTSPAEINHQREL